MDLESFIHDPTGVPGIAGFHIQLAVPVELTADLSGPLSLSEPGAWVLSAIDIRKDSPGRFFVRIAFDQKHRRPADLPLEDLISFRDLVVSLLSFTAAAPVRLLSKGVFVMQHEARKFSQRSLGAMEITFPYPPLPSGRPLAEGIAMTGSESAAMYLFWQAANSTDSVARFANLAMCVELVVNRESTAPRSRHPVCAGQKCGYELTKCPSCERNWTIPAPLGDQARLVFGDEDLIRDFIRCRNRLFHGSAAAFAVAARDEVAELNNRLILALRAHFAPRLGLPSAAGSLPLALNLPEVIPTVFYTTPGP